MLFLYGLPSDVKKQLQTEGKILSSIQGYEVAFHRYNFLHLTGVKLNKNVTMIGEFTGRGPKLYAEKAAGNVCGCNIKALYG